jgi:hypothetical protein
MITARYFSATIDGYSLVNEKKIEKPDENKSLQRYYRIRTEGEMILKWRSCSSVYCRHVEGQTDVSEIEIFLTFEAEARLNNI